MMDKTTKRLKLADVYPELAGKVAQKLHIKKEEIPFVRKFYDADKSEHSKKERAVTSYITTNAKDRDDEVLLPKGMKAGNYEKGGKPVFWGHSYKEPKNVVGQNLWLKVDADEKGIIAKTAFRKSQFADEVYNLYTEDLAGLGPVLKGWSVGFIPIKWDEPKGKGKDDKDTPKKIYTDWELLEYSAVPIASNPDAISLAYKKGLITCKGLIDDFEIDEDELLDLMGREEIEIDLETISPDGETDKILNSPELMESLKRAQKDVEEGNVRLLTHDELFTIEEKVEVTENYIRIPVSSGHGGHRIRTITISASQGIKALYCGDCKKVVTYLFDKDKWDMARAQTWVNEHKRSLEQVEIKKPEYRGCWNKSFSKLFDVEQVESPAPKPFNYDLYEKFKNLTLVVLSCN